MADSRQITVTGNATYTATFSNEYNVALFTNGGSIIANGRSTYTYSENATPLPGVDDLEYGTRTALGWYAKADFSGTETWEIPARSARNLVYYLKWSDEQPVVPDPEGETFNGKEAYHDTNLGGYYSTFYSSASNYLVPAGYTAYKAVIVGEKIRLEAIGDIIPRSEGVLLYSETVSTFDLVPTNDEAAAIGQNDFTGTDSGIDATDIYAAGKTPYVFSSVEGVVGFYKLSSSATIPAHKAYVIWPSGANSAPPRMLHLDRPAGVTTDIDNAESEPVRLKGVYSILGHELNEPVHGTVNIIDGELKFIP